MFLMGDSTNAEVKVNRQHKASMFSSLFSDPDILRELYGAIEGIELPVDTPIEINTLENVLFMGLRNDVSFEVDGKLVVLLEHQSTINPNMPLRFLQYVDRLFDKIVDDDAIHSKKQVKLPYPVFFVLYNGEDPFPSKKTMRLSDAFENPTDLGLAKNSPMLELTAKVININEGQNAKIARKCKTLAHYSAFIAKIREYYGKLGDYRKAIKAAIKYCREHDILKEYLETHNTEVFKMLAKEWTYKDELRVRTKEAREDGVQEGMEKGRNEGVMATAISALKKGFSIDVIRDITGLDTQTLKQLAVSS
jgi:predicted transposase/invertase (TIGR01784 family)